MLETTDTPPRGTLATCDVVASLVAELYMSRFGNLEFNESSRENSGQSRLRDEQYYLDEATAFFQRGQFESALRSYAKVLEHNPRSTVAWSGQVRMLVELGEFREAKLWADKGLELHPSDPELLASKAVALARTGDLKGALAFSDAAIGEQGDLPYVWLARGDVMLARKEKVADYCFQKAFSFAPNHWIWRWLAARALFFYQQFSRALREAQEGLNMDSAVAVLWLELGRAQLALGMSGPAQNSLEQAHQLDPEGGEARLALAKASETTFWEEAFRKFRSYFRS